MSNEFRESGHGYNKMNKNEKTVWDLNTNGGMAACTIYAATNALEYTRWIETGRTDSGRKVVELYKNGPMVPAADFAKAKLMQIAEHPLSYLYGVGNNVIASMAMHTIKVDSDYADELCALIPMVESDLDFSATAKTKPAFRTMTLGADGRSLAYDTNDGKRRSVSLSGMHRSVSTPYGPVLMVSEGALAMLSLKHGQTSNHSGAMLPEKVNTRDIAKWETVADPADVMLVTNTHKAIWTKMAEHPLLAEIAATMLDAEKLAQLFSERAEKKEMRALESYL